MPGGAQGAHRPGADAVDANLLPAEVPGEVAHAVFQGRLANAHHVIARDDLFAAVVADRDDRAAIGHQRGGRPASGHQAIDADVHGQAPAVAAHGHVRIAQLLRRGEGDGMDQKIEPAVDLANRLEHLGDILILLHVAGQDDLRPVRARPARWTRRWLEGLGRCVKASSAPSA